MHKDLSSEEVTFNKMHNSNIEASIMNLTGEITPNLMMRYAISLCGIASRLQGRLSFALVLAPDQADDNGWLSMSKRFLYAGEGSAHAQPTRLSVVHSASELTGKLPDQASDVRIPAWHLRSRSQQALLNAELTSHQHQLWNAASIGFLIVDRYGSVISSNACARRWLEPSSLNIDSRGLADCVKLEDRASLNTFLQKAFDGEKLSIDVALVDEADKTDRRYVRLEVESQAALTILLSVIDVTEPKRLEAQSRQVAERQEQLQRLELVHCISAGIVHDFKNIVQVIESYAAVLCGQSETEPVGAIAQGILAAASRGAMLANRWLVYGRYGQLEKRPVNVAEFLTRWLQAIEPMIPQAIRIETRTDNSADRCSLDPCLIEQVLTNLCMNARDAMPAGGVLSVSAERVYYDSQASSHDLLPAGEYIKFCVADTGTGVSPENMKRIFEPFFTTKEHSSGTGLGLPLVRSIVSEHQGAIEVWSEVGRGSKFTFYLPAGNIL